MVEEKLSDSYHRARRMFALLCGILIVWEYVGIEVGGKPADSSQSRDTTTQVDTAILSDSQAFFETAVDTIAQRTDTTTAHLDSQHLDTLGAVELPVTTDSSEVSAGSEPGGAAGTMPIVGIPVTFRNPEVIPTVIFILVLYFGFRFTIEWRQCPESVRDQRATRVDAWVAYAIGLAAVALFLVQRSTELRLAELGGLFTTGLGGSFIVSAVVLRISSSILPKRFDRPIGWASCIGVMAIIFIVLYIMFPSIALLAGAIAGYCVVIFTILLVSQGVKYSRRLKSQMGDRVSGSKPSEMEIEHPNSEKRK